MAAAGVKHYALTALSQTAHRPQQQTSPACSVTMHMRAARPHLELVGGPLVLAKHPALAVCHHPRPQVPGGPAGCECVCV